jgi:hypothetical protein
VIGRRSERLGLVAVTLAVTRKPGQAKNAR